MVHSLSLMLERGEGVVYREAPTWNPRLVWTHVLEGLLMAAIVALAYFGHSGVLVGMAVAVVFWATPGYIRGYFFYVPSRASLITDRRVLSKTIRKGREIVTEIPLAEIAAVDVVEPVELGPSDLPCSPFAVVRRRDGQETLFDDLPSAQDFAAALARQAGLTRPPSLGRLEHLAFYCLLFGGANLACLGGLLLVQIMPFGTDMRFFAELSLALLGLTAVFLAGMWLGTHLAALLAVALMPLYASAEQAGNWLRMRQQGRLAGWALWKRPAYFKLATLVYGRPLTPPTSDGGERHVR